MGHLIKKFGSLRFVVLVFVMMMGSMVVDAYSSSSYTSMAAYKPSTWKSAHATFYGDETASETMGKYAYFYYDDHLCGICKYCSCFLLIFLF